MKTISAIVITKNEEMHIESCIKSLQQFADEVIIYDSMSTDRTEEIATSLGAKFIPTPNFPGYGPQRINAHGSLTPPHTNGTPAQHQEIKAYHR